MEGEGTKRYHASAHTPAARMPVSMVRHAERGVLPLVAGMR
jgi:hypothetical protein